MKFRHGVQGVKLDQQKELSLKHKIKNLPMADELPLKPNFNLNGKKDYNYILNAAQKAQIVDEFDGIPLDKKLKKLRGLKPNMIVACCFDEDPWTTSAMAVLREYTAEVISGLEYAAKACGIKGRKIAVATKEEAKFIKSINSEAELILAGDRYPARVLLKKKLYSQNIKAFYIGAQACLALDSAVKEGKVQQDTVVTVAGRGVERWSNVKVPLGTELKTVLKFCGVSDKTKMIITGSSLTGKAVLDLTEPVTPSTRCIIAIKKAKKDISYPCIGCEKCASACVRSIVPWKILKVMKNKKPDPLMLTNVQKCIGCQACSVVCPSGIDLAEVVKKAADLKKSGDFE